MSWDTLAAGQDCPFCLPRTEPNGFWDSVAKLDVSTLCLLRNQAYRGHCILIYDPKHVSAPDQLSQSEWTDFAADAHKSMVALRAACAPAHLNAECLGNQMPHLHWQLIPRYKDDPRWLGPIWTNTTEELHRCELPEPERAELIEDIRAGIGAPIDRV
jgi:diadenosine tetraphosphate (Ap4A) HIT family hydrolase